MAKVAGSIWVEGLDLHFIDQFNREWYYPGYGLKVATAQPGSIWIQSGAHPEQYLLYINEGGTAVYYISPYGDALIPASVQMGSLWIGQDNQIHWAGITWSSDPNYRYNVRGHNDVAPHTDHTDHTDVSAHSDVAHSDRAHTDTPAVPQHTDVHGDVPHSDHNDTAHGDVARVNFGDHVDCNSGYLGQEGGLYYWYLNCGSTPFAGSDPNPYGEIHSDQVTSGPNPGDGYIHDDRAVHWDFAHTDTHTDTPHGDRAVHNDHTDHTDNIPHNDIIHLDTPHQDVAHTDNPHIDHQDNSVHTDEPILIGP